MQDVLLQMIITAIQWDFLLLHPPVINKYFMGDEIKTKGEVTFKISLPIKSGEIRIIHNGKNIKTIETQSTSYKTKEKGVYRVEVYLNKKAWIFSNHIKVI